MLLTMDESRLRLRFMRRDPRVALTVLYDQNWGRHMSLLGHIAVLHEDVGLRDTDRLALHFSGEEFRTRDRRRFSAWMEVTAWQAWDGSRPWQTRSPPRNQPDRGRTPR